MAISSAYKASWVSGGCGISKGVLKKRYKGLDAGCPVADFYERETGVSQLGLTLFVCVCMCVCCENGQSI
jgi:hypothetical protein